MKAPRPEERVPRTMDADDYPESSKRKACTLQACVRRTLRICVHARTLQASVRRADAMQRCREARRPRYTFSRKEALSFLQARMRGKTLGQAYIYVPRYMLHKDAVGTLSIASGTASGTAASLLLAMLKMLSPASFPTKRASALLLQACVRRSLLVEADEAVAGMCAEKIWTHTVSFKNQSLREEESIRRMATAVKNGSLDALRKALAEAEGLGIHHSEAAVQVRHDILIH